jgi:hypothetical protein
MRPSSSSLPPAGRELAWHPLEDHDRMARGVNDVVVGRIFAADLDLQAALELIGDHRGTAPIQRAIDELGQAVHDIRDAAFDHGLR